MKLIQINPDIIKIPEVRITSFWDPEEYDNFKRSLDADGQQDPIQLIKEGEIYWLVDGLHRLNEAKLKGWKKVAAVYVEGSLVDAMTKNLYKNRLRGRTKASEEASLVHYLQDKQGLSFSQIQEKTGIQEERLTHLLSIGKSDPLIQKSLDAEEISVGAAFQLSRIPNLTGQVKLLMGLKQMIPFPTIQYVKEVVDETLKILAERTQNPERPRPVIAIPTVPCVFCEQEIPVAKARGVTLCLSCLGLAKDYIDRLHRQPAAKTDKQVLAELTASANEPSREPNRVREA